MTDSDPVARVGERIRELRMARGLSLSELARRAGLGKGTLSELETGRRNATLETLYAVSEPLGVGLAALIGNDPVARPAVRDEVVSAVLIDLLSGGGAPVTEVYRLTISVGGQRISPAHGRGVRERLTVVSGVAVVGPAGREKRVVAGGTHAWTSDREHTFCAEGDEPAVGVLLITHPNG